MKQNVKLSPLLTGSLIDKGREVPCPNISPLDTYNILELFYTNRITFTNFPEHFLLNTFDV